MAMSPIRGWRMSSWQWPWTSLTSTLLMEGESSRTVIMSFVCLKSVFFLFSQIYTYILNGSNYLLSDMLWWGGLKIRAHVRLKRMPFFRVVKNRTVQNQTLGARPLFQVPCGQMNSYWTVKWWEQWTKHKQTIYPVSCQSRLDSKSNLNLRFCFKIVPLVIYADFGKRVFLSGDLWDSMYRTPSGVAAHRLHTAFCFGLGCITARWHQQESQGYSEMLLLIDWWSLI